MSMAAIPLVTPAAIPSSNPESAALKAHHPKPGSKRFENPWDSFTDHSLWDFFKSRFFYGTEWPRHPIPTPEEGLVSVTRDIDWEGPEGEREKARAVWLGHACFWLKFPAHGGERGLRVLFDPVFSDRCSPFSFMGPKRYTPPPCPISAVPTPDAVVISHNHYDHLDVATITYLRDNTSCQFFIPLGNKQWLLDSKIPGSRIQELDWWDELDLSVEGVGSARVGCLPAQHFTGRGLGDRYHTLWASWQIRDLTGPKGANIYFAGDTGYRAVPRPTDPTDPIDSMATSKQNKEKFQSLPTCPAFREIGNHRGPFDLALIPVGAYDPRYLMSPVHCSPEDAVEVFRDVRARKAVGMHWGAWVLTSEEVMEPVGRLREAMRGVEGEFGVVGIGEGVDVE
ncbi:Metallo-hydrolase/oxidoreductase [Saitoella complicata NRRL Y-17804]|uniref:Metallo-beta-lactamase domain-containing protein n=1 Tax=Saitoella complicata (strain BCRC 22490 / CBS 7301 / JCM 7358 / NBRC 10748 / NRRL Y-17804) TaxID=698492 RepID=A0A0E9NCS4_SAICN|nr:Metallo-hydrolase/oxidoreductase [Saitoella complicata NRRL Y-17804]ODQ49938.1 Metallo-hydrolase/oxidoreductase [Saitoella complicata NRRL Y-17804]GAO47639.1 hypothetical protein G7K_1839-t1 [Saitoella complicata NRRL Y-17804]